MGVGDVALLQGLCLAFKSCLKVMPNSDGKGDADAAMNSHWTVREGKWVYICLLYTSDAADE